MKKSLLLILAIGWGFLVYSQEIQYETRKDIQYYNDSVNQSDDYINERCVLDVYLPKNSTGYATVVWFHGGGMKYGKKEIPEALKEKGICVVGVNYRLYPRVSAPAYIEDAAAAVAWAFNNIEDYGGDSSLVFVSGHSAGGYLTSMVGLDKSWLSHFGVDADRIAGLIPFSGHAVTHMTVREEMGIPKTQAIVDKLAPLYHVRPDAPPLLLITGDRTMEMLGRYEENAYFMRMMKVAGHQQTVLYELDGYNHVEMAQPAFPLLVKEVQRITKLKNK